MLAGIRKNCFAFANDSDDGCNALNRLFLQNGKLQVLQAYVSAFAREKR